MSKKLKIVLLSIAIALFVLLDGYTIFVYLSEKNNGGVSFAGNPKNAEYIIEGQPVKLVNGSAETPAAPGSATKVTTKYFGNEVKHDFNNDGLEDTAFLLTQETGGSGLFYYVAVALDTSNGYVGSSAFFIGDRIAPQTTEMDQKNTDELVVNYADRKAGESFAVQPSVGKSLWLKFDPKAIKFIEVKK